MGVTPRPAPGSRPETSPEAVVSALQQQFAPILTQITAALSQPVLWKATSAEPDFAELVLRIKYHVQAAGIRGQREYHRAVVEGLAAMTGLNRSDLDELATVDPLLIREGRWLPKTARVQRLAMDAQEIDLENPDAIVRMLNQVSTQLPKVKSLKLRDMRVVANGLDKVYAGADLVFDKGMATGLNRLADWLDSLGQSTSSEVRNQYREMGRAVQAVGLSARQLKDFSENDQKMALLSASAMSEVASDIDVWFDLLKDPKKLQDQGFLAKFRNVTRVGLEGAVLLIGGAASALHQTFDQENLRDFNVNILAGAGLEVLFCGGSFGIGLYLPSVNEMRTSEHAAAHVDFALGVVAPFGSLMASSRGGKKQLRLPFLKVRNGEFSQAIGVGTGLIGGVNFLRDKTYGAGVEAGWFPKLFPEWVPDFITKVFNVRAGGNLVVHHPAMRVQDKAVAAAVDAVQKPLDVLANSLVRAAPASTPAAELKTRRLQNLGIKFRQAKRAFSATQGYRLAIESARREQRPLIPPGTDAYDKCTRGCTIQEAERIIENFLGDLARDGEERLGALEALLSRPPSASAAEERALQKEIRAIADGLKDLNDRFNMADVLLCQVFGKGSTRGEGQVLSQAMLDDLRSGEVVHWALTQKDELYAAISSQAVSPTASQLSRGAPTQGSGTIRVLKGEDGAISSAVINTTATERQGAVLGAVRASLAALGVRDDAIVVATGTRSPGSSGSLGDVLSPPTSSGRQTRIIATLDPSMSLGKLGQLIRSGMDIARINLSHDNLDQHLGLIENVRTAAERLGVVVPILVDLPGPKLRLGKFDNPAGREKNDIVLVTGRQVTLSRDCLLGNDKQLPFEYETLLDDVKAGHRLFLNDARVELLVEAVDKEKGEVRCHIARGGIIWDNVGMNLPDTNISLPTVSNADFEKLRPLLPHIDQIGISFVREARDVFDLRQAVAAEMAARGLRRSHLMVAKIETSAGVRNLEEIAKAADVLMAARGDLQAEIGFDQVPEQQARIQKIGRELERPVIVATGVMSSMVNNGNAPTQGEADGLASVVRYQDAHAILLSRETRSSIYAAETLKACSKIIRAAEAQRQAEQGAKAV